MIRAYRESPTTMVICTLWVVLFLVMAYMQGGFGRGKTLISGEIYHATARQFGDLTIRDVVHGQPWRIVAATFVHFSLLHLAVNLFGMYQLGTVLESWYGPAQFLGIYAAIALVGNALAVGVKLLLSTWFPGVAAFADHPSGGGSTVLCGLIAMLAVVGWRSRTRYGNIVKAEMVGILAFTALLGVAIPRIDNFGHAGGALAGALVGLFHRPLLRNYERPSARRLVGFAAALLLLAVGVAQVGAGRFERRAEGPDVAGIKRTLGTNVMASQHLQGLLIAYGRIASRHPGLDPAEFHVPLSPTLPPPTAAALRRALLVHLSGLDASPAGLDRGETAPCYRRVRELGLGVLEAPPAPNEVAEFVRCTRTLLERSAREIARSLQHLNEMGSLQVR